MFKITRAGFQSVCANASVFVIAALAMGAANAAAPANWTATWATANKVEFAPFDDAFPAPATNGDTLRQIVRISVGGSQFRVWLTNELGSEDLEVGSAHLALRDTDDRIVAPGQPLTFGGASEVTILPGTRVVSDPVQLQAADNSDLVIDIYLPNEQSNELSPITYHPRALQTNYQVDGEATGAIALTAPVQNVVWAYLAAVDVTSPTPIPVMAGFGDSLTDGDGAGGAEPIDLNARYTNFLSGLFTGPGKRLGQAASVVNLGISGNMVNVPLLGDSGVNRFGRDVLSLSGVTHVIIWEGINDIGLFGLLTGSPLPAAAIQSGLQAMADEARDAGLVVIGCTLTPSGGFFLPTYQSALANQTRLEVNEWIRNSGTFDIVVDLDALARDEVTPELLDTALTPDGLHFTPAGYEMVAAEIYAQLFSNQGKRAIR